MTTFNLKLIFSVIEEAKKFTGPEYLPLPMRLMMGLIYKTLAKKIFQKMAAASLGCRVPLDKKVWETNSSYAE
ncbi:hypothetical protein IM774_08625 [Erysipelotrichaceae bacterium RD49]|nr:hypothetical protein [Erysipelotrichaceae bacterium RD49]